MPEIEKTNTTTTEKSLSLFSGNAQNAKPRTIYTYPNRLLLGITTTLGIFYTLGGLGSGAQYAIVMLTVWIVMSASVVRRQFSHKITVWTITLAAITSLIYVGTLPG